MRCAMRKSGSATNRTQCFPGSRMICGDISSQFSLGRWCEFVGLTQSRHQSDGLFTSLEPTRYAIPRRKWTIPGQQQDAHERQQSERHFDEVEILRSMTRHQLDRQGSIRAIGAKEKLTGFARHGVNRSDQSRSAVQASPVEHYCATELRI